MSAMRAECDIEKLFLFNPFSGALLRLAVTTACPKLAKPDRVAVAQLMLIFQGLAAGLALALAALFPEVAWPCSCFSPVPWRRVLRLILMVFHSFSLEA